MAILKDEDLELEILPLSYHDWEYCPETDFKVTMRWKGIPLLNEAALKRTGSYWEQGKECGIVASEQDSLTLIKDFEDCLNDKKVRIWEAWPDPDMTISIYPERYFPYLEDVDSEYISIIVSPDLYQFKDSDCYSGYSGVSFVMVIEVEVFKTFVSELKTEFDSIMEPFKSKRKKSKGAKNGK